VGHTRKSSSNRTNSHQVASDGRSLVASELRKRGAGCVTSSKEGRKIYLRASSADDSRTVQIQVKAKNKGNWQTTFDEEQDPKDETNFWIFVDLTGTRRYWIAPDSCVRKNIRKAHQEYLNKHGGRRARNDASNHHSIDEKRLEGWQDRWDILRILPNVPVLVPAPLTVGEEEPGERFSEGQVTQLLVNAYERNPQARAACIAHYGARCYVCRIDFGERYGPTVNGFIHVHHLCPLSSIGQEYAVDPVADLRPVCPNCHAVIHSRKPPYSMEEVRRMLRADK
jgi:hypothetical protein